MRRPLPGGPPPVPPTQYKQSDRLRELALGEHDARVLTLSSPASAPNVFERLPARLAAAGMFSRTDVTLGEEPVPAPTPLADAPGARAFG